VRAKRECYAVLDASAILAYLKKEKGYEQVRDAIQSGVSVSAVNFSEVLTKVIEKGLEVDAVASRLLALGLVVHPFTEADARQSAQIVPMTRALCLSMGDRACLALSLRLGLQAMTADTIWAKLGSPFKIVTIR
jgi:PIN domain nuclease of toxin-antitoxin system